VSGPEVKIDNKLIARAVIVIFGLLAAAFVAADIWATMHHR
jgi:hypothetical protein